MLNQTISKIENEMKKESTNQYVQYIGRYLIDFINENPNYAEKLIVPDKTILGSLKNMENEARKHRQGNMAMLTPEEGFKTVMDYFDITAEIDKSEVQTQIKQTKKVNLSLDEL